jgi:hypothetical protein
MARDGATFRGAIVNVDGVLVDAPHELAWREALQQLMEGEWSDIRGRTGWTPQQLTPAVYRQVMAGRPRLAGARAALEYFGVPDVDRRAQRYAEAKQARLVALIERGRFVAFADALRFVRPAAPAGATPAAQRLVPPRRTGPAMTTTPTPDITTTRHATLADLTQLLQQQRAQQCDVVAAATAIRSRDGVLLIHGAGEPVLDEHGVTPTTGRFRPTAVCDEGFAAKLDIPVGYLRRLRRDRPDVYDLNINALLHGRHVRRAGGHVEAIHPADDRKFLLRLFRTNTGDGVARAALLRWGGGSRVLAMEGTVHMARASSVKIASSRRPGSISCPSS